jgi:hypothetical protein
LNLGCVKGGECNTLDRLRLDSIIIVLTVLVIDVAQTHESIDVKRHR